MLLIGNITVRGDSNVQRSLKIRGISAEGDIFALLLESLRSTKGFTSEELNSLNEQRINELLKCIGISIPTDRKPIEVLIEYQSQNCQAAINRPTVTIESGLVPVGELVRVLESRGVTISPNESRSVVESALEESDKGHALTESEMSLLTRNSIVTILDKKNITFTASEDKTKLIRKLF